MRVVVDTNVLISGLFFGGYPKKILAAILKDEIIATVSLEILEEYQKVIQRISEEYGKDQNQNYNLILPKFKIITPLSNVCLSRDKEDDKFINCAIDSKSLYIISGDEDLLVLKKVDNIEIITAKQFCESYLKS